MRDRRCKNRFELDLFCNYSDQCESCRFNHSEYICNRLFFLMPLWGFLRVRPLFLARPGFSERIKR